MNLNSILLIVLLSLFSYGQYVQIKADNAMINKLADINSKLDDCNFKLINILNNIDDPSDEVAIKFNETGVNVKY